MSYVYFERNNNAVNVEEVKTKEEFESIFGNNIPEAKSLKIRIKELLKLKNTEVTEYSLYKIIELERVSNDTYLYNPKMDIIEELAIVDYLYDLMFHPFRNQEDSIHKLLKILNVNKEESNNKKETVMNYAYFIKNNNEIDVEEKETIEEVIKELKVAKSLGKLINEISKLKIIDTNINFHDVLYKINELEIILKVLFIHNTTMSTEDEIGYINTLYNDLCVKNTNKKEKSQIVKTFTPRDIFTVTDNICVVSHKHSCNKKSELTKKKDTPLYTFIRSKKDPNKVVIIKANTAIVEEFKNAIEGDLCATRDWLAIPIASVPDNTENLLKELDKLEKSLGGKLISNPLLSIGEEITSIKNFNEHIDDLLELSSKDKHFRNRLINLLLED